jgi:hypothetical protein
MKVTDTYNKTKKLIFCLCFALVACVLLLKRISIIVIRVKRGEEKEKNDLPPSFVRRSMITLYWLSSVFRRVLRRSSLIFTRYLLSILSCALLLSISLDSHRSSSMNYIHSNNNLTVAMCMVSIQLRTHTHISWKKRSKEESMQLK